MAKLEWNKFGERFYETGVDRGVLYLDGEAGVPWNGLISVKEDPTGGEAEGYYLDGIKYANLAALEEFQATLEAFSAPEEFSACDGTQSLGLGLFVTQQVREEFGLSYRTLVGNDLLQSDYGYKIHLVYNCLAAPANRENNTLSRDVDPMHYSWTITTVPPILGGVRPTAHYVVDSTKAEAATLAALEDILYGTDTDQPRLPTVQELFTLFNPTPGITNP